MAPHLAFFAVEVIGLFAIVLLGSRMISSNPARLTAQLAAFICLNAACGRLLARYEYGPWIPAAYDLDVGMLESPLDFLRNLTPGLFMLLCHALFREQPRFPRWLLAAFVVQALLEVPVPRLLGTTPGQYDLLEVIPALLQLVFVGFGLYWTLSGWRADMVEDRRRLRALFLAIVGTYVLVMVLLERLLIPWLSALLFTVHASLSIVGSVLSVIILWLMLRPNAASHLDPFRREMVRVAPEGGGRRSDVEDSEVAALERALRVERVYREGELTIGSLAARLAIPEYRLRRLIHERLQFRNFNALLHRYRIAEACDMLADSRNDALPILTIALTVGYNSINPFNRAFRDIKGMTPSAFRSAAAAREAATIAPISEIDQRLQ
jgi:AraC-like DNA-binding protein